LDQLTNWSNYRDDTADGGLLGVESASDWPSGCYTLTEGMGKTCCDLNDCIFGVWLNYDQTGGANECRGAQPVCKKIDTPVAPPAPPPPLPPTALPDWVPFLVLLACAICFAAGYMYHLRRFRLEVNLRNSRDRAQLDLQLLAHQLEQTVRLSVLTESPHVTDASGTRFSPVTKSRSSKSRSSASRSHSGQSVTSDGTSSELGKTFFPRGEAGLTLSEVPGATRLPHLPGRSGRPLAPYAASSASCSSMGTAAMEANVHLLSRRDIEERYELPFDQATATVYAPVPQFGSFSEVLSEADRAKLLVCVGRDGRIAYASTGEPINPSPTHMFVALASGAIYIRVDDPDIFHHDLAGNAPVVAAGEMFFTDGRLLSINNRSGHYRPPPKCLRIVLSLLRSKGAHIIVPFKEIHYDAAGNPYPVGGARPEEF